MGGAAGEISGVHGDGLVEEGEVVELVGHGDGDPAGREYVGTYEEE